MGHPTLPPAIIEKGVVCTLIRNEKTTQHGKPISLIATINSLPLNREFLIDKNCKAWRSRVGAALSHINKKLPKNKKIRLRVEAVNTGKLKITRI
jgi:hypothetical protein